MTRIYKAMTIAGSDSGGGAGIQADLKTFAANGVYGTSVLTAITAQNTRAVTAVQEVSPEVVMAQMEAVFTDIGADAVKTGMLSSSEIIEAVAEGLRRFSSAPLVVDPVMVAKSGDRLLREDAVKSLRETLLPLASVVTPNVPEAEALAEMRIESAEDARRAAARIWEQGPRAVVVKGGHLPGAAVDRLYDGEGFREFASERVETENTHGTGCTFAAAIAAGLAKGLGLGEAVASAKEYVTGGLRHSYGVGGGHGPLNHFWGMG